MTAPQAEAVEAVERLAPQELTLLHEVIAKRQPDLLPLVDRIGTVPLNDFERSRLRRVVVDELCEHLAPGSRADRRDLALSDLLLHLGRV